MSNVNIFGGGLAGCEAALYLANHGVKVKLFEQKPHKYSPAHKIEGLAELVCSNSLKADRVGSASGLLKAEMMLLGQSLLTIAQECRVAAGGALAVDRYVFSQLVTDKIKAHENIELIYTEATEFIKNGINIIATGPLTEGELAKEIKYATGSESLSFYDAAAPIITADSLDMTKVFAASRYERGDADYLNCAFDKKGYDDFYAALVTAERAQTHEFEKEPDVYEGCMPIEIMAKRGADTMRFGPLRPVGIIDPATEKRPWANVQLRAENKECTMYNLVGFQTNLKFGEQKRVFSMIPGLENAEFVRYGVMHRNSFIDSPNLLNKDLSLKNMPDIFFAGQITGFEGYVESMASGLLAARAVLNRIKGKDIEQYPLNTMCGALLHYIFTTNKSFQPMGANMGLLPPCEHRIKDKQERYAIVAQKSLTAMEKHLAGRIALE